MQFLGSRDGGGGGGGEREHSEGGGSYQGSGGGKPAQKFNKPAAQKPAPSEPELEADEDDIPF